jgi:hypothetical protein
MTRARWAALLFAGAVALLVAAAAMLSRKSQTAPASRPKLMLLTSLPILFGDNFSLDAPASPAIAAIRRDYDVVPISVTSADELAKGRLLLLAQPPVQTAENLVALDEWVRRGGRVLLFADPMLEWPSARPLGDPLRPAPMFMDTGLLKHWGLRLDAPDRRGPQQRLLGGYRVLTVSPGALFGSCGISADRLVARCRIGKGEAIVVADADLLDVQDLGPGASQNLEAVLAELASLRLS